MLPHVPSPSPATLADVLRGRAAAEPETVVYTFLENGEAVADSLTYGELDRRARQVGARLQGRLATGARVVLLYLPGLEFIIGFLGASYAGVVPVPVYPPRGRAAIAALQRIAGDAGAEAVLSSREMLKWQGAMGVEPEDLLGLPWVVTDQPGGPEAASWSDPGTGGDSLAFLQYTSGSTGSPKGVMVSHANLFSTLSDIDRAFDHRPESVMISWLPTFHDMGLIYGVILPLRLGIHCYLMSPLAFLQRPIRWLRAVSTFRGTHSAAPNFAYDLCVRKTSRSERSGLDLGSWRVASNGAEPIRERTLGRFAEAFSSYGFDPRAFCPSYGLAEATLKVSTTRVGEPLRVVRLDSGALEQGRVVESASRSGRSVEMVGCGDSAIGAEILIVDPASREPCPQGQVGEIWVSSPSVALGYWNRPRETTTFGAFSRDGRGPFLRTGDLGFFLRSQLFVTGRLKDVIIVRGRNYSPHDIESTVERTHPALRPGCGAAFSVPGEEGEDLVVLQEVRPDPGAVGDPGKLLETIRRAIVGEHGLKPSTVCLLPPGTIPKTSSGKVRRRGCRQLFLEGSLEPIARWPTPP